MIRALHSASTGMSAQQLNLDVIANNLANVNTVGFKRNRVDFQDLMYQTLKVPGSPSTQTTQVPTGLQVGLGTKAASTQKIFTQGVFQQTENPLDVVIEGDGFFQITLPDGTTAYTRDGSFKRNAQGNIVNSDGYLLNPAITIPNDATEVSIGVDGTVSIRVQGSPSPQNIGQITLARFANPAGLESTGRNLFSETAASGTPLVGNPGSQGYGTLSQGYLEMSNVKVVEEMVNMITAQRAYEINSKVIQGADEMLGVLTNLKR